MDRNNIGLYTESYLERHKYCDVLISPVFHRGGAKGKMMPSRATGTSIGPKQRRQVPRRTGCHNELFTPKTEACDKGTHLPVC